MNKKKAVKKKVVKKKDTGMGELLGLLKTQPHLVHALVVDHKKVRRLLKSREARRLIPSDDARNAVEKRVLDAGFHGGVAMIPGCLRGTWTQ